MMVRKQRARTTFRRNAGIPGGRWLAIAGLVFVVSWVVGLLLAPSGPDAAATPAVISHYYLTHRTALMIESYLIDGVAGVALLFLAAALRNLFRQVTSDDALWPDVVLVGGVAAGSVSLVQAAVGEALANRAAGLGNAAVVATLFDLVNMADTFKLLALGLFAGAVALLILATRRLPRWLGWLGALLGVGMPIAGLAFPLQSGALYAALVVLLPLLLLWVAGLSVVCWQRSQ